MKYYKYTIPLIIILMLSFITAGFAFTDEENKILETKYDFYTEKFIFEYNDYNTTEYEGDSGLTGAYANNTEDNMTYFLPVANVRTMAYLTNGSFKMNEHIDVKHSLFVENRSYDCIMLEMFKKDGSQITLLDIKESSLTKKQKEYFDDYDTQRADYQSQQQTNALEDLENSYSRANTKEKHPKYSYYISSRGNGIIYTP